MILITLNLNPLEIAITIVTVIGFITMFIASSLGGTYQDLIKTTLDNDEARRKNKK